MKKNDSKDKIKHGQIHLLIERKSEQDWLFKCFHPYTLSLSLSLFLHLFLSLYDY